MASITMNSVPNWGTISTTITGNEKFVIIGSNGKPSTVEVNQILNKVDDKIDDVIEDQIDDRVDNIIDEKIEDALDEAFNLTWNNVE